MPFWHTNNYMIICKDENLANKHEKSHLSKNNICIAKAEQNMNKRRKKDCLSEASY